MAAITLRSGEIQKAKKLLADYFKRKLNQLQLDLDTNEGIAEQDLFTRVLAHNSLPKDGDFMDFMRDRIWAIHETLRFGLLQDIVRANKPDDLRKAFRVMLIDAPNTANPDDALQRGKLDYLGTSILSEALCKVYPDRFSIKNKRSEWALYFILSNNDPEYIEHMSYTDFIGICWQIWNLVQTEYEARKLAYDRTRRLWYVDRFYLWVYERPETKEIMKVLGYKD